MSNVPIKETQAAIERLMRWCGAKNKEPCLPLDERAFVMDIEMVYTEAAKHMPLSVSEDVLLFCPRCKEQHIDGPEPGIGWNNPPHRKHLCHVCGHIWKAAYIYTNGVANIPEESGISEPKS